MYLLPFLYPSPPPCLQRTISYANDKSCICLSQLSPSYFYYLYKFLLLCRLVVYKSNNQ